MRQHSFRYDVYFEDTYIRKVEVVSSQWARAESKAMLELKTLYPNKFSLLIIKPHFAKPYYEYRSVLMTGKSKMYHE